MLRRISDLLYKLGLLLFAVLLPLELVPNRLISVLSLSVTALLLQRVVVLTVRRKLPRLRILPLVLFLPLIAYAFSTFLHHISIHDAGIITMTMLAVRAWAVAQFTAKDELRWFENATLAVAILVIGFGIFQYVGDMLLHLPETTTHLKQTYSSQGTYHFARVHSVAREPLLLANYLFIPLLFCAIRIWLGRAKILHYLILVVGLALLLSLNSRGAYYALILVSVVLIITAIMQRRRAIAVGGIGLAVVVGAVVAITRGSTFIKHAFELGDASFTNRVDSWSIGIKTFKKHVLSGVGPIRDGIYTTYATDTIYQQQLVYDNTYMTIIAKTGLIGLSSWIAVAIPLVSNMINSIKQNLRPHFAAYGLILLTFAVQISTFEALLNLRFWGILGFSFAAIMIDRNNRG